MPPEEPDFDPSYEQALRSFDSLANNDSGGGLALIRRIVKNYTTDTKSEEQILQNIADKLGVSREDLQKRLERSRPSQPEAVASARRSRLRFYLLGT